MASSTPRAKPINRPSVRHPSHNHPLRAFKSQEGDEFICSGCELELIGQAFKCTKSECDYFLHKSCFDLPSEIHHKSHLDHPLTLLHSPPYGHSTYTCNACGEYGSGFTYHCSECQYNVHIGCTFIPENVEREDHEHLLVLLYNTPCKGREDGMVFTCDACKENISENIWVYYCKECDYGTHVYSCAVYDKEGEEASPSSSRMNSVMEAEMQMAMNKLEQEALDNGLSYLDSPRKVKYYYW